MYKSQLEKKIDPYSLLVHGHIFNLDFCNMLQQNVNFL